MYVCACVYTFMCVCVHESGMKNDFFTPEGCPLGFMFCSGFPGFESKHDEHVSRCTNYCNYHLQIKQCNIVLHEYLCLNLMLCDNILTSPNQCCHIFNNIILTHKSDVIQQCCNIVMHIFANVQKYIDDVLRSI